MLNTIKFDLNMVCKRVAVSGGCNELMRQSPSETGLAVSTGIALDTFWNFSCRLVA